MAKKNYLSHSEQELWDYINEKEIIDSELITLIFPEYSMSKRNKLLSQLTKKNLIQRAKRGLYFNPKTLSNYYALALRIHPGYIALTSALKLHGLIEYEDFTIYIFTQKYRSKVYLKNYEFIYTPHQEFAGYEALNGIQCSTVEKTIIDCLHKPRIVSLTLLIHAIRDETIDWDALLFYSNNSPSACQKLGQILQRFKPETPTRILEELKKNVRTSIKLSTETTKYDSTWKVQFNEAYYGA